MLLNLPQNVTLILDSLEAAGFEAFCVGGCVRDLIMGRNPSDFDITTCALPEEIKRIFPHTADTGLKHGTVTVIEGGVPFEVTTYRTEGGYTDRRRPDSVSFVSDITLDLARRDFTVNAIAYSPKRGLCDPYGGCDDIKAKILRAVGDPKQRFNEDALRILRLFRFESQLGFSAHPDTRSAALTLAHTLSVVSRERIATELIKSALGENPDAIEPLISFGGLEFIGIKGCKGLSELSALPKEQNLRLFAILSLCDCDIAAVTEELKLSTAITNYCQGMEKILAYGLPKGRVEIKKLLRDFGEDCVFDLLTYSKAVNGTDTTKSVTETEDIIASGEPYKIEMLDIRGNDLIKLGINGRDIGITLSMLLDRVILNPLLNTKQELLNIAKP